MMIKRLTTFILMLLLFTPLLQMQFGLFPEKKLSGKVAKAKLPGFSVSSLYNGEFQSEVEKWLKGNLGLRGKLIRTDNQLNYWLFGLMSSRSHTPLILGKDNFLFEKSYIDSYNRNNAAPVEVLETLGKNVKKLQEQLKPKGVELLLLITPSKAEVYPDKIPAKLIRSDRDSRPDDYLRFIEILKNEGIQHFDAVSYAKKLREESEYEVFAPGGTHWNYFTACKVASQVSIKLKELLGKNVPKIPCEPLTLSEKPKNTDRDLSGLANLWDETPFETTLPYPPRKMEFSWEDYHPKALIIGDSFTWTPLEYFDQHGTFSKRKFFYYYNSQYTYWVSDKNGKPKRKTSKAKKLKREKINWENDVLERDTVIIFVNQSAITHAGHGFIADALTQLAVQNS